MTYPKIEFDTEKKGFQYTNIRIVPASEFPVFEQTHMLVILERHGETAIEKHFITDEAFAEIMKLFPPRA